MFKNNNEKLHFLFFFLQFHIIIIIDIILKVA